MEPKLRKKKESSIGFWINTFTQIFCFRHHHSRKESKTFLDLSSSIKLLFLFFKKSFILLQILSGSLQFFLLMDVHVKQEIPPPSTSPAGFPGRESVSVVDLCSSDDDSDCGEIAGGLEEIGRKYNNSGNSVGVKRARDIFGEVNRNNVKKVTTNELAVVLPEGFGQSNPHAIPADPCNVFVPPPPPPSSSGVSGRVGSCKQFWKAGDYEGAPGGNWDHSSGKGIDFFLTVKRVFNCFDIDRYLFYCVSLRWLRSCKSPSQVLTF